MVILERKECVLLGRELHLSMFKFVFLKALYDWILNSTSFTSLNLLELYE